MSTIDLLTIPTSSAILAAFAAPNTGVSQSVLSTRCCCWNQRAVMKGKQVTTVPCNDRVEWRCAVLFQACHPPLVILDSLSRLLSTPPLTPSNSPPTPPTPTALTLPRPLPRLPPTSSTSNSSMNCSFIPPPSSA